MKFASLSIVALQISAASSARAGAEPGIRGQNASTDAVLSAEQKEARTAMISGKVTKSDVEIVLAHCNEDTSWAAPLEDFITVYSQCPGEEGKSPIARAENVPLSNVGKESHAYIEHIVRNYDRLADWTVFTQAGRPSDGYANSKQGGGDHLGGHLVRGSLFEDYVLAYASGLPHYFVSSSAVDPESLSHNVRLDYAVGAPKILTANRGTWGIEDRCLPADSPLWMAKWIQMDPEKFEPLVAQKRQCGTECPSLLEFAKQLGIPGVFADGEPIIFSQGARFAVSKERLLRHPKAYYQDLLEQVSHETDPWQGYFFEYLWYHMLAAEDEEDRMCEEAPLRAEDQMLSARDVRSRGLSSALGISGIDEEEVWVECSSTVIELFTDPGMVTAKVPDLFLEQSMGDDIEIDGPGAGDLLEPGEHWVAVMRGGELMCIVTIVVTLDEDSAVMPEVQCTLQGDVPSLEIVGPMEDELGNTVAAQVFVDGSPISGTDLSEASDIYDGPGIHMVTVEFTDAFDRTYIYESSECFEDDTTEFTSSTYTTSEPIMSSTTSTISSSTPSEPTTTSKTTKASTTTTTTTTTTENCRCELKKKLKDSDDCAPGSNPTGSGTEDYKCVKQKLTKLAVEVTDRWGDTESHAASDSGYRTDELEIVCYTIAGDGTETKDSDCKDCCPKPVIIITVDANIGALKVYAEDGTDRSRLSVTLEGSGIGSYSVKSSVATGFQSYSLTNGITVGANAGIGASHEGGSASGGLTGSTSTTTTYAGNSYGWQTSAEIPKKHITSWAKGECSKDHTLSVSFDTDMLADVDDWEQFFGITSDTSKALLSKDAKMVYSKTSFRCDGEVPTVGVSNNK